MIGIFKTKSMALAAYLSLQGFKPIKAAVEELDNGQPVVEFHFEDPKGFVRDMAIEFRFSDYSKFFDIIKEYRTLITKTLREHLK